MTPHDIMLLALAGAAILLLVTFWIAHRNNATPFNALDLIMTDGKVDKIAFAFMVAFAVSTWVVVDQQIKGKLTDGLFGIWISAWVGPLVVKVVFGKNEMPGGTTATSTTLVSTTTETKQP